jgi:hypothetical protein
MAVYRIIADAEAKVHGGTADTVNFHEVGAMDAVADVLAVCLLLQKLSPDAVICSTVTVGYGHVHCAHGILPVPAPATANILLGMPITAGHFEGELCTPTGAALLKHFVTDFGNLRSFKAEKIGYGMGTKNFPAANCVRALLGETAAENDSISVLSCNLDDMTPEAVGFAMELLLENGALDAFSVPVTMKKSRPAVVLTCLCKPDEESKFTALMLKHTSTLGVRKTAARRTVLEREFKTVETPYGTVRIKLSHHPEKSKPEYDDVAKIARDHGLSFDEARKIAEKHL